MGKAQEMVRHGCGRIVGANGLCVPCLERDRAATAELISDGKGATPEDAQPFEGTAIGAPPTSIASGATAQLRFGAYAECMAHELVITALDPYTGASQLEWLDVCDFKIGTLSLNHSQHPVPCAGAHGRFRWRFDRPYAVMPGVDPNLTVHNRFGASVLVRAGLYARPQVRDEYWTEAKPVREPVRRDNEHRPDCSIVARGSMRCDCWRPKREGMHF